MHMEPLNKRQKREPSDIYLQTINRGKLDFDFDKVCSVNLANTNVYACLCCGKYFQGRNRESPAFSHSINDNHHVFINMATLKCFILPENSLLEDDSLEDIKQLITPSFSPKIPTLAYDLQNRPYKPGFIGLSGNEHSANAVIQSLSHVYALRDHVVDIKSDDFIGKVSLLFRKIWSSRLFKPHVAPHEVVQYLKGLSKDPKDILVWVLNKMAVSDKAIGKVFQGKILVDNKKSVKFWTLSLDLPRVSLIQDEEAPQVSLESLLEKFKSRPHADKNYKILRLPHVVVLCFDRRIKTENTMTDYKRNPTLVRFPLELDFGLLVELESSFKYRLIANIIHSKGRWKVQLLDKGENKWFEIEDTTVRETERELLFLSETCIQFWERMS